MSTDAMQGVVRELRRAALFQNSAELTDAQLVESFLRREEGAFDALLRRHGKVVLGVCRRVLGNTHDAEDAFQATFLVFVQKAATVRKRELLGSWLYGVAYRIALEARTAAARRRTKEGAMRTIAKNQAAGDDIHDLQRELQLLLDRELNRLPDKYRVPIVLCDLEGKTQKEVARMLGCPQGTVSGRLARARVLLATRLRRHGLALSGGALAWTLAQDAALAAVPPALALSTSRMADAVLAGQPVAAAASANVSTLATGALKAMLLTKLKVVVGCFVLLALGCLFTYQALGSDFAGDNSGPGQVPIAAPGASEKKNAVPENKRRLFVTGSLKLKYEGNDSEELFIGMIAVDPETGRWKKITEGGNGYDMSPRGSPDGETLVFVRDDAILTCATQGADNSRKISDRGGWPIWSPKGERLLVSKVKLENKSSYETWLMEADGSNAQKLPIADTDLVGDWSRDGKWLLTVRHAQQGGGDQLYVMRPDGKEPRRLTTNALNRFPRFSPDSRQVAYVHHSKEGSSIWIVDVDGKNDRKIMAEEDFVSPIVASWSPDGNRLAVLRFKWQRDEKGQRFLANPENADYHIEITDAAGQNHHRLDIAGIKIVWLGNVDWR